jgi:hypothetical protein
MMIRTRFGQVLLVIAAVGLLGALTVAQSQGGADQLLQAARTKAAVEGKLDEAIKLYADVVAKFKADRPTVVRALIEMADCYDKLGQAKARELYEQIVRERGWLCWPATNGRLASPRGKSPTSSAVEGTDWPSRGTVTTSPSPIVTRLAFTI